jgi:adenylate cyclase
MSAASMGGMLDVFYDECAGAIWDHDGLLNKTIGDAVMAVFNFPIRQADHARQALLAAHEIQRHIEARKAEAGLDFGVGIGIHCGELSFGEFGRSHRDLTAIGTVVNTAARAQSAAQAGQVLVTQAVRDRSGSSLAASEGRLYPLKGIVEPVPLYAA